MKIDTHKIQGDIKMDITRGEIQDALSKFSTENADYRANLKADPKNVIVKQFGVEFPQGVDIKVVEETADTLYVVLPHAVEQGAELSDADLEAVAGGGAMVKEASCDEGILSTVINMEASLM